VEDERQELPELAMTVSESYRIPTTLVPAELVLLGGERCAVALFLATQSEFHPGPETLFELLNSDRRFVPARDRVSGTSLLVNRRSLLLVEVERAEPANEIAGEDSARSTVDMIRVELAGGVTADGALEVVASTGRARLSDFFNEPEAFFRLSSGSKFVYVNKRCVLTVSL
jgi:hypothetical protein